jgi:NADPH:quinone reductase-like Zn-dependent oxidoreductase
MQAIFRTRYGSADVLELKEIDKPLPKDNEVLVRVRAATGMFCVASHSSSV